MIRAIGFDLDDTLYDHAQYVKGAYRDVAEAVERWAGVAQGAFFHRIYADWQRRTSRDSRIFADALSLYGIYSSDLEQQLVEVYREHQPALTPYPAVVEHLEALREAGLLLGVLTDGQVSVQQRKLRTLQLEQLFDVVIYTSQLGRGFAKPHPRGFRQLADGLGVAPTALVYVGDNPLIDFESAKQIGMRTARVLTGEYRNLPCLPEWVDGIFPDVTHAMTEFLTHAGALR